MAKTFRFTDEEEQALNETALKLNRDLVKAGQKPLRDTEIFHEIIKQTLINGLIEVNRDGAIKVETKNK
jgi:site-specific DNA-adenine methylase